MTRLEIDEASLGSHRYGLGSVTITITVPPEVVEILGNLDVKTSKAIALAIILYDFLTHPTRARANACLAWLRAAFPDANSIETLAANLRYLAHELDGS